MARNTNTFIERTILGAASLLEETLANEEIAARPGLLQGCDPRFKCAGIMLLIVAVLLCRSIWPLTVVYALCLLGAAFSAIRLSFFIERTLLFVPLFSFFIALPAIFSVVSPGETMAAFKMGPLHLSITREGIAGAGLFVMRVMASVSLSVLLVLTTRHHALLKTLRMFNVPQIFVMTMGMCYRYILLLLETIRSTFLGIKSRVGFTTSSRTGRRVVALNMAAMWLKSYRMHAQVYDAMVSRGYTGEPIDRQKFHPGAADYLFIGIACVSLLGTLWLNRFFH